MTDQQDWAKIAEDRREKLLDIMRERFGVVNPVQHVRMETHGHAETRVAVIDPWPTGTDKRAADHVLARAGFEPYPLALSPYGSAVVILPGGLPKNV